MTLPAYLEQASIEYKLEKARRASVRPAALSILDKRQQLVEYTPKRVQAHLLSRLTGRDLILKARQMGISTAIQARLFDTALHRTALVGVIAHDNKAVQKLRDMQQLFYDQLPGAKPERAINNATRTRYPHTKSVVYIDTAGNVHTGRAGTYSHIHGSEVAFWKDAASIMAGLLQGVPMDGQIVLESTPNGAQGWFYERCMEALKGEGVWALHFYEWWWDATYTLSHDGTPMDYTPDEQRLIDAHDLTPGQVLWRRQKQSELGSLFLQEYPEDPYSCFLTSGDGYFNLQAVTFTEAPPFERSHRYVAGLDFGQANDATVCSVIDATTCQQAGLYRARHQSWEDMRAGVRQLCKAWNVSLLVAENNSMGSTNIEAMNREFQEAGLSTFISPFETTHSSKAAMIGGLKAALGEGGLTLLPDEVQRHELTVFTSRQTQTGAWTYSAPTGEHDDTVIALALAWHGLTQDVSIRVMEAPAALADYFGA